jgi:L-asparaginase II
MAELYASDLPAHVPLAITTRGDAVECVHYGSIAVVDRDGGVLHAVGDAHALTFTRSALKPLQALPFVRDGGPARFGFASDQVALMCASHSGEPRHVKRVADMLARAGKTPADLMCGAHAPLCYETRGEIPPPPPYSPLAHNCSGKHAGMLACCALHHWGSGDYLALDHPLQREIRAAVATFAGVRDADLLTGIDGCSAPNYAMPLAALARSYARLADRDPDRALFGDAHRTLCDAMVEHPAMVSGAGRSDETLMEAGRGDWVSKVGAEGVQAIGIRSRGIGIAIKVADGAKRALFAVTAAVLDELGLCDDAQRRALEPMRNQRLVNARGIPVGRVRPLVTLAKT